MNERLTQFLAKARACSLSPVEHAQARAEIAAHMTTSKEAPAVLQESAESLRLTPDEKAVCRSRLLHFMRTHPAVERRSFLFGGLLKRIAPASIASALAVTLLGGSIAFAAEDSLPGDLLYPVKVHITEPIISSLTLTSSGRAQWNIRTIERRLEEADALGGRPDQAGRQTILHSQIEQDAATLQDRLHTLPEREQRAVRHDLLSKLADHQKSLRQIQTAAGGIPPALKTLAEDAAGEIQEPVQNDRRNGQSFPSEQKKQDRQKPERNPTEREGERIIVPPPVEKDRQETSPESSRASAGTSSSSENETPETLLENGKKEDRQEGQENAVQSLLRLLRESSSSSSAETSSAREQGPESRKERQKVEKEDGR